MITVRNRKIVIGVNNQHKDTAFALCAIIFLPAINNFLNCILQIALDLSANGITEIVYVFMFCLFSKTVLGKKKMRLSKRAKESS